MKRSLQKAVTYRVVSVCLTAYVTLVVTGDALAALNVSALVEAVKFGFYVAHERAWESVDDG